MAIGTHDLDNIKPPFSYEALPPKDISFVPLTQTKEFTADKLMEFYETDASVKHIKPYVPIIKDSPVYPVRLFNRHHSPPVKSPMLCDLTRCTVPVLTGHLRR